MRTIDLVILADLYAAHRGLALSTVSTYAANDGKYFGKLKGGAGCTLAKALRLFQWFSDNWPTDLEWPRSVTRPSKTKRAAA